MKKRIQGLANVIDNQPDIAVATVIRNVDISELDFLETDRFFQNSLEPTKHMTCFVCKNNDTGKYLVLDKGWLVDTKQKETSCIELSLDYQSALKAFLTNLYHSNLDANQKMDVIRKNIEKGTFDSEFVKSVLSTDVYENLNIESQLSPVLVDAILVSNKKVNEFGFLSYLDLQTQELIARNIRILSIEELKALSEKLTKTTNQNSNLSELGEQLSKCLKHQVEINSKGLQYQAKITFPSYSELIEYKYHMENYYLV